MRINRSLITPLVAAALLVTLSACQKEEGPAERAGKVIDNAVEKTGEKIEEAGKKIQDVAKEAEKDMQKK